MSEEPLQTTEASFGPKCSSIFSEDFEKFLSMQETEIQLEKIADSQYVVFKYRAVFAAIRKQGRKYQALESLRQIRLKLNFVEGFFVW
jgi:hypothetical protein